MASQMTARSRCNSAVYPIVHVAESWDAQVRGGCAATSEAMPSHTTGTSRSAEPRSRRTLPLALCVQHCCDWQARLMKP